jgi:hypothetical protein
VKQPSGDGIILKLAERGTKLLPRGKKQKTEGLPNTKPAKEDVEDQNIPMYEAEGKKTITPNEATEDGSEYEETIRY